MTTETALPVQEFDEDFAERAEEIMDQAVETAGELLVEKPNVAEVILKQLLKCDPEHLGGLQLLGLCKHRMGNNAEAVEIFQTALELDPTSADNYNNIGLSYGGLDQPERAIENMKKAIELNPDQFLFLNNIALQYRNLGDRWTAIDYFQKAIEKKEMPQVMVNMGGVYGELKEYEKAQAAFERAIEVNPEYSASHVDLAMAHHLQGHFKEGNAEYEWRFQYYPQMCHYKRNYDQSKRWNGKDSLEGKTMLIYCEQGLGDAIQYIRYTKHLKDLGARVIVHCPKTLDTIIKRCEGVDATVNRDIVYNKGDEFPEYDFQCAIMSLPHLLNQERAFGEPYIKPVTEDFRKYVKEEYGESFNIGIVWAGSPAHPHDKRRSIPLKNFKGLCHTEGVRLFSLQLDVGKRRYGSVCYPSASPEKLSNFQEEKGVIDYCQDCDDMNLVDLTPMIQSFEDTATILAGLDLVICCDTAVAHLAGAMGVACWMAIPYNPDWRWKAEGCTTDWYDSIRIYRQPKLDDWEGVFKEIEKDLHETILQNK